MKIALCKTVFLSLALTACGGAGDSSGTSSNSRSGNVAGTITAEFNGEPHSWRVSADGVDQGYYRGSRAERNGSDAVIVYLFGRPAAGGGADGAGSLFLSFNITDFRGNASVPAEDSTQQITYLTTSLMESHSTVNNGSGTVQVTSVDVGGNGLRVVGTFEGTVVFKAMNRYASPDDPGPIDVTNGRFEATVPMEGFD